MIRVIRYRDGVRTQDARMRPLRRPATPVPQVRAALADLAAAGWPIAACPHDHGHGDAPAVDDVLLYRDPSRTATPPSAP